MKTAQQYAEGFYDLQSNNYDSIQDLTQMFQEYAKEVAQYTLTKVSCNMRVLRSDTDAQVRKEILDTEIKTP